MNNENKEDKVIEDIENRLGEEDSKKESEVLNPSSPIPFDPFSLSAEQLQSLKAMLAVTPESIKRKKENPRVRLRRINGNIVEDIKNAYLGMVDDPENHRKVEKHLIPVKFFGVDGYTDVLYSEFINSEQVPCEVVKTDIQTVEKKEGTVVSRETGKLVEMISTRREYTFHVKLPDGKVAQLAGKIANA